MKSMKITKEDRKKLKKQYEVPIAEENYPYGLELHLEEMSISKMGMNELPKLGTEMTLMAKVKVESASESESRNGKRRSLRLQITDMELTQKQEKKNTAQSLYGS